MKTIKKTIIGLMLILSYFLSNAQDTLVNQTYYKCFYDFGQYGYKYYPTKYELSDDPFGNWTINLGNNGVIPNSLYNIVPTDALIDSTTSLNVPPNDSIIFIYDSIIGYSNIVLNTSIYGSPNLIIQIIINSVISYTLNTGPIRISQTINQTFTITGNDIIKVKIYNTSGYGMGMQCHLSNFLLTGTKSVASIKSYSSTTLIAFPNPAINGQFTIKLNTEKPSVNVSVYDISGNSIYSNSEARTIGDNEIQVQINAAPGMYLIKADDKVFKMFIE